VLLAVACGSGLGAPEAGAPKVPEAKPAEPAPDTLGYELPTRAEGASFPEQALAPAALGTRIARLSHTQYEHTVQDLLGVPEALDLTFAPDALDGFGFDTSHDLRVDLRLGPQYRAAAEALAERAVTDPATFARLVPCAPVAPGCRDEFLRSFGARAFRRPLAPADLESFQRLFDAAAVPDAGDPFRAGVRRSVAAMLQSPEFLYVSFGVARPFGAGARPAAPDDYEVAARLSYFLYDSMPDEALFAAARTGRLHTPDQVEAAARHMLTQPRVLEKLVDFHDQLWQFERFARISPDPAVYPNAPKDLIPSVRHATTLFVRDVLRRGGGLTELLTAPYAYADAGLSALYGTAPPSASRFARVDFDPAVRRGLLLQVGYLASNAYSIRTDPIHRGLFVIRNLLCRDIPDPPPGATTTPPPETDQPIVTTRDEVSLVTGQSFCPTCHTELNAPGFAFEGFDAMGQRRATENGAPVETSASMVLDGRLVSFDGAVDLVEQLARSREAHRCYSRRWLEFAYGRPLAESDLPTLERIASQSLPIADIIVAIVRSPAFLAVAAPETETRAADPAASAAPHPGARR
jgi:hypothetical protein